MQYTIIGPKAKYSGNCVMCGANTDEVLVKSEEGKFGVCCAYHHTNAPSINKRMKAIQAKAGSAFEVA